MQTLNCTIGNWRAEAQVEEVDNGKLMAVISLTNESGNIPDQSRHTVVFEHHDGSDRLEETREMVRRLLRSRYG